MAGQGALVPGWGTMVCEPRELTVQGQAWNDTKLGVGCLPGLDRLAQLFQRLATLRADFLQGLELRPRSLQVTAEQQCFA